MNLRPAALAAVAGVAFLVWLAWGVAHPATTIVTVYEPYIEAPVLIEQAPAVVIVTRGPREQQERLATASAALATTTLVEQTPVGPPEVTYLEFAAVIAGVLAGEVLKNGKKLGYFSKERGTKNWKN